MSEINRPMSDPLDTPCGQTDTSFPLLQGDKVYRFEIKKATVGPGKKNPSGQVLVLQLNTTTDATSTKGEHIAKGFPIYHRVSVTPTPEYDGQKIAKGIAQIMKAVGGDKANMTPRQVLNDPKALEGAIVDAKIVIAPEKDGFPESNIVRQFVPAS